MNTVLIVCGLASLALGIVSLATGETRYEMVISGFFTATLMCGLIYVINRYGFKKINTIAYLEAHPEKEILYIALYSLLAMAGFYITYSTWN